MNQRIENYQQTVKTCSRSEWPRWVCGVWDALHDKAVVFSDLPDFAYSVYAYLKANPVTSKADA